ncbi:MAG: hypothetical protein AB7E47_03610 [Desulfovibrionaceae bacterium]
MKKLLTVLFVFAALLTFTVSSATAASFFVQQNSTTWTILGLQGNGSTAGYNASSLAGTMTLTTPPAGVVSNYHGIGAGRIHVSQSNGLNTQTYYIKPVVNATYSTATTSGYVYASNVMPVPFGMTGMNGTGNGSTYDISLAGVAAGNLLIGVSNATTYKSDGFNGLAPAVDNVVVGTLAAHVSRNLGTNMLVFVQPKTDTTTAMVNATAWYMYSTCQSGLNSVSRIGYVNTSNSLTYSIMYDGAANTTTTSETLTWAVNADGTVNASTTSFNFGANATLDMSGYSIFAVGNASNAQCFSTFVKGASFTTSDLSGKEFNTVGFGMNGTSINSTASSIGYYRMEGTAINSTASATTSYLPVVSAGPIHGNATGTIAVASATYGATHTKLTLGDTTFYGVMRTDGQLFVGIATDTNFMTRGGIYYLVPQGAAPVSALAQTTAQVVAATGIDFNVATTALRATYGLLDNATQYFVDVTAVQDYTTSMAANGSYTTDAKAAIDATNNYTDAQYIDDFNAPAGFTKVTNFAAQAFTLTVDTLNTNKYAIIEWPLTSSTNLGNLAGKTTSSVQMYKFMNISTAGNQTVAMTMVPGTNATTGIKRDGYYWWAKASNDAAILTGHTFVRDTYDSGDQYVLWVVLADNGQFDADKGVSNIIDPPVGATITGSSSSSSSGCVFNPAASFGLEWMLLLIAPVVAVLRNRFRK